MLLYYDSNSTFTITFNKGLKHTHTNNGTRTRTISKCLSGIRGVGTCAPEIVYSLRHQHYVYLKMLSTVHRDNRVCVCVCAGFTEIL